jgi:predicted O-methyltransferase YrrM
MHEDLVNDVQKIVDYIEAVYRAVLHRPPTLAEAERHAQAIYGGQSPMEFFHAINGSDERRGHAKLFVAPGSYQSPVANPAELETYVRGLATVGPELPGIAIDRAAMIATWERLLPALTTFPFPAAQTAGYRYYYDNPFFGFGDGLLLHALLRSDRPRRYIEIGSGFSSACAVDTVDAYLDGSCEMTFIEPQPERLLGVLGARTRATRVFNLPVQGVALGLFDELEAGDVLFIDSSHVLRTGSDVGYELLEVLPRLASGVLVHIHDMLWPFDYPEAWILRQNRSYNEAYAVRALLVDNPRWEIVFFNDYFVKFEGARIRATFPQVTDAFGGSLWLRRR